MLIKAIQVSLDAIDAVLAQEDGDALNLFAGALCSTGARLIEENTKPLGSSEEIRAAFLKVRTELAETDALIKLLQQIDAEITNEGQ